MRWGRKGARVFTLSGRGRGRYYNFEAGRGGSVLDLIMDALDCDLQGAEAWGRRWLRVSDDEQPSRTILKPKAQAKSDPESDRDPEEERKAAQVRRIWSEAVPIPGTPAEAYLRRRGILAAEWPSSLRWHPQIRALICACTAPDGRITAIQRIFLNDDGTSRLDDEGRKVKRSLGSITGRAVRFSVKPDGPLVLAEGPETALSVWWATGYEVWAALGQIGNVDLTSVHMSRTIIVALDDDPRVSPARVNLMKAIRGWRRGGRTVLEATPWPTLRGDKSDFNDALQAEGQDHVRCRLQAAQSFDKAGSVSRHMNLLSARKRLSAAVSDAISRLRSELDCPPLGIRVDVGVGKTHEAIGAAVGWIAEGYHLGEGGRRPVVFAVPTHKLGRELLGRLDKEAKQQDLTLQIACWRGRDADDPDTLGQRMCRNIDAVRLAQTLLQDVQETVCKAGCPHFATCAYQQQRQRSADIWVVPHASLFHQRPDAIGQPSLVIIDEGFWQASLRGFGQAPVRLEMVILKDEPLILNREGKVINPVTNDLVAELMPLRRKLVSLIEATGNGPLTRKIVYGSGLTAEDCASARRLEWKRKPTKISVKPDQQHPPFFAKHLASIRPLSRLWSLLEAFLEGEGEVCGTVEVIGVEDERNASGRPVVALCWADTIKAGWQAPTLHIDATLHPELVSPLLPDFEVVDDIAVKSPHQRVLAVTGKSFAHSAFEKQSHDDQLYRSILYAAAPVPGRTLAILPKKAEKAIRARHAIPDHIALEHHGAIAGLDAHGDVDLLIVVGRMMPSPRDTERMASALSSQWVPASNAPDGWYEMQKVTVAGAEKGSATMTVHRHPHVLAESIRHAICEDQIVQAIGRGRGVNRAASNPLQVEIWGEDAPPLPVDEVLCFSTPSSDDRALGLGMWLESAADLSRIWPELGNEQSIKDQRRGTSQRTVEFSYIKTIYENPTVLPSHFIPFSYHRAAQGAKLKRGIADSRVFPDPKVALEERVGLLKVFELTGSACEAAHSIEARAEALSACYKPMEASPQLVTVVKNAATFDNPAVAKPPQPQDPRLPLQRVSASLQAKVAETVTALVTDPHIPIPQKADPLGVIRFAADWRFITRTKARKLTDAVRRRLQTFDPVSIFKQVVRANPELFAAGVAAALAGQQRGLSANSQ